MQDRDNSGVPAHPAAPHAPPDSGRFPLKNLSPRFWVTFGLFPLMAVPVWAAGGTYKPWQTSFLWFSVLAWATFFLPASFGWPETRRSCRLKKLLQDPAFWFAATFLLYLLVQHLNTGRIRVFDFQTNTWTFTPPRFPGLPWSITRDESFEMLSWFAPALSFFLIARHSWALLHPWHLIALAGVNGFLNALLAFVHQAMGWESMYNFRKFGSDVYGSFGYPNHGALYFILLFALALGLMLRELFAESSDRDPALLGLGLVWTPVFFLAAHLSTSRAGILGAWLVLILTVGSVAVIAWPRLHPVQRVTGLVSAGLFAALLAAGFLLTASELHLRELRNATVNLNVFEEINGRFFQIRSAWEIWRDHPVYGVGGWGYRYFVGQYLPREQWSLLGTGKANVHHDLIQFLAEFGLIGFTLLSGVFVPFWIRRFQDGCRRPTRDASLWADPLRTACVWGLAILMLDSQFDIPLRSPAVMIHGLLLLLLLTPHADHPSLWPPVTDWKRLRPLPAEIKGRIRTVEPEGLRDLG